MGGSELALHGPILGVIFDMDGVIVDSEPFWRRVECQLFDTIGIDVRPYLEQTMALRIDEAVRLLVRLTGAADLDVATTVDDIVAGVIEAVETEGELMPGVAEALEFFEGSEITVALASGSTPPLIDAVLARFDLRERFQIVCSAHHDLYGKPHPAVFLRAAGELGLGPSEVVVIEDSVNGVIAAKAASMRTIAVPSPEHRDDPRFSIADVRLASLLEIERVWPVGALEARTRG